MINRLSQRYDELAAEACMIEETTNKTGGYYGPSTNVDEEMFNEWCVKSKSLIVKTCGDNSEHIKAFNKAEAPRSFDDSHSKFKRVRPVFMAAKSDFQGGYLSSIRNLVQAELFNTELEQAVELVSSGYKGPEAVVAGVVLETALRNLCADHNLPSSKLDKMNSDLTKAGVYDIFQQKKITALADIRNRAAHGYWDDFSADDVNEMIRDVERFLSNNAM